MFYVLPDSILSSFIDIFADDSTIYSSSTPTQSLDSITQNLSSDLGSVVTWGEKWLVSVNATKTKSVSFHHHRQPDFPDLTMDGVDLVESDSHDRLLGLTLSSDGTTISRELQKTPRKWLDHSIVPEILYLLLPFYTYTRAKFVLPWNTVVTYGLVLPIALFLLLTPSNIASKD